MFLQMIEYKYEMCIITPPGICVSDFWGIFIPKIQDEISS